MTDRQTEIERDRQRQRQKMTDGYTHGREGGKTDNERQTMTDLEKDLKSSFPDYHTILSSIVISTQV